MGATFVTNQESEEKEEKEEKELLFNDKPEYLISCEDPLIISYCEWLEPDTEIGKAIIRDFGSLQTFRETVDQELSQLVDLRGNGNKVVLLIYSVTAEKLQVVTAQKTDPVYKDFFVEGDLDSQYLITFFGGSDLSVGYTHGCKYYSDATRSWVFLNEKYQFLLSYLQDPDEIDYVKRCCEIARKHELRKIERMKEITDKLMENKAINYSSY